MHLHGKTLVVGYRKIPLLLEKVSELQITGTWLGLPWGGFAAPFPGVWGQEMGMCGVFCHCSLGVTDFCSDRRSWNV